MTHLRQRRLSPPFLSISPFERCFFALDSGSETGMTFSIVMAPIAGVYPALVAGLQDDPQTKTVCRLSYQLTAIEQFCSKALDFDDGGVCGELHVVLQCSAAEFVTVDIE